MNASKTIMTLIRRSYGAHSGWKRQSNPGIQKRLNILEDGAGENDSELIENIDLENEPDFSHAHQSYSSYKKELTKNKELLKLRIVARKYFKEFEPNMLTYVEKEQIRHLRDSDPVEYTAEKLSEGFPALPGTIRKILKAKWTPRSAERVLKHDQQVIENWKKLKRGELPLDPRLREHLQKFKTRKISLPDKEELEKKLVPPEKTFAKPKSQLYSGIIQSYLDQKKDNEEASVPAPINNSADPTGSVNEKYHYDDLMDRRRKHSVQEKRIAESREIDSVAVLGNIKELSRNTRAKGKDFFTLDEFFKDRMKNIDEMSPVEDKVLVDTYKKKMESETMKETSNFSSYDRLEKRNFNAQLEESDTVTVLTEKDFQTSMEEQKNLKDVKVVDVDSKEMGLETYVKLWEKKASDDETYPESIVIPKQKYKRGKLYKLGDCYYDNDGEFLYRVPGFKN